MQKYILNTMLHSLKILEDNEYNFLYYKMILIKTNNFQKITLRAKLRSLRTATHKAMITPNGVKFFLINLN